MNYAELTRDYANDSDWRRYHEPLPEIPRANKVRFIKLDEPHLKMEGGSIRIRPDVPDAPDAPSKAHRLAVEIVDNITGDLPGPSRLYWLHKAPQIASMIMEEYGDDD